MLARRLARNIGLGLIGQLLSLSLATAAVIMRDVTVDVGTVGFFRTTTDVAGNSGQEFAFEVPVTPFFVQLGDQIVTRISFSSPLLLQDSNNSFWSFPGTTTNWERFSFLYAATQRGSGTGTVFETTLQYTMSLDLLGGNALQQSASGSVTCGGYAICAASFLNDWTQSAFILRGLEITTKILSYELIRNDGELSKLEGSIMSGGIRAIPEPDTLALLILGLAALTTGRSLALTRLGSASRPSGATSSST